jgi:ribonucleoside-triphosphate reductase
MLGDERLIEIMNGGLRCKRPTEVYSRVCGFFRPVQAWNLGKKEEYKDRVTFKAK